MAGEKDQDKKLGSLRSRSKKRGEDLSNYVFGKVQPQAIPLEEAVLGALMLDKDAMAIVLDILRVESFYLDAHQLIYQAMLQLFEKSQPIDLLTVTEELKKTGNLEAVGGPYYLVELSNKVASAANIEYHARIIAQKYVQRELISVSTRIIRDAYEDTTDVFNLLDDAEQGLFAIAQQNMSRGFESMSSLAAKARRQIEELRQKEDGLTGVPTGFTELDRLTSGLQRSDLIILAARPGMGKCLGKGTKVLMYDGSLKKVEDVKVGDLLMGDNSTPRRVLSLARGRERMYWIRQNKGKDYRVNESHILSLKKSRQEGAGERGDILDISVKDYLSRPSKFQSNYKGYKVAVDFPEKKVPLPPYFLGLWLGDGSSYGCKTITQDEEAVSYLQEYAGKLGMELGCYEGKGKCPEYRISNGRKGRWGYSLQAELRNLDLLENKHVPKQYLINSKNKRLQLLAGLIDSNGHYLERSNGYEITQKDEALTRQIKFLCDSLGYRVSFKAKKVSIASTGYESTAYRLRIYGNIDEIPVLVKRKQAREWRSPVDWQVTGIQVEYDRLDDYYGFEIDGNGRFLLEDMTVTHNTALTLSLAKNAAAEFGKPVAIFSLEMSALQLAQRVISMEAEISGMKMRNGQLEEYEWEQLNAALERISEAPLFIDDTPGINIFELRAKARRLKMQHDIDLIIIDYLQLMSGGGDNQRGNREQEVSAISRALKGLAKELNVPVIALSQLSRAVEVRGGTKRPQLSDLRESGCLTGDALLQDAGSGRLISIKELAERTVQKPMKVVALGKNYQLGGHSLVKAFYSGRKEVFELRTKSGRYIKASSNHPFLKLEGWTPLEKLRVGDRIAAPRKLEIEKPDNPLSEDELIDALESIEVNPNNDVIPKEAWRMPIEPAIKNKGLRACLEVVLWKRKWPILGSHEAHFRGHSSAMGEEIAEMRFQKRTFAAQMTTSKHALSWPGVFREMNLQYSSGIHKNGISRERLNRINQVLQDGRLAELARSGIFWDEIASITPLGEEDVYDATIEGVHNFVANDIIVHNSIEQDADIVAFIYRPEYYDILEDEEGQSLKGVAEVIVAKHRHGALKTIKLRFTDEYARFSDLDDPDFSVLPENALESPQSNIITRPSKMNDDEDIPF